MDVTKLSESERLQEAHYGRIVDRYEVHATDPYTQAYRRRFIDEPITEGIDLRALSVLEAMCGHGGETSFLLQRGATVTGLDISAAALDRFTQRWPQCESICDSILSGSVPDESFDCVVAVGGLHHMHPNVSQPVGEIHRILKPGGYFCFSDPHAASMFDVFRRLWYRLDDLFEENEAGVDVDELISEYADRFEFVMTRYVGSVAYLLVLNSLAFRMPYFLKRLYSPAVMALEATLNRVTGRRTALYVVAQWKKR